MAAELSFLLDLMIATVRAIARPEVEHLL